MTTKYIITNDGTKLAYTARCVRGAARGLIVVHGLAEHKGRYVEFIERVHDAGISVFAVDLRGHGESGGTRGDVRKFDDYVSDLDEFVKHIRREFPKMRLAIFGHSMGGLIVASWAALSPPACGGSAVSAHEVRRTSRGVLSPPACGGSGAERAEGGAGRDMTPLILTSPSLVAPRAARFLRWIPTWLFGRIMIKKRVSESPEMLAYSRADPYACHKYSLRLLKSALIDAPSRLSPPASGGSARKAGEGGVRTFSLSVSAHGELTAIDGASRARLIGAIERATGLKYRATMGDVEFLLTLRDNGDGFLLQRITRNAPPPPAGALEPHVAQILVRASAPRDTDVFIDPFCGSGAIPLARASAGAFRGIFAMDSDAALIRDLKSRAQKIKNSRIQKSFFARAGDFLQNKFEDNFADAIVTDPPWGEYQKIAPDFYPKIFAEFARILKPGGRLILLTGRDIAPPVRAELSPIAEYPVLIHGKKARAVIWQKS